LRRLIHMANPTEPKQAAQIAKNLSGELRAAVDHVLREHGLYDWHLRRFSLTQQTTLEVAAGCPDGEEYDCRLVGTEVVCQCFPKKP
jgi:hypothetical protein